MVRASPLGVSLWKLYNPGILRYNIGVEKRSMKRKEAKQRLSQRRLRQTWVIIVE